jgi:hypothetical protein
LAKHILFLQAWLQEFASPATITSSSSTCGTSLQLLFIDTNPAAVWQQGSNNNQHGPSNDQVMRAM